MKNFGKYAVIDPVKHVFAKEPEWYWLIKAPTAIDELAVAKILSQDRDRIEVDGSRTRFFTTTLEVAIREIAVTYAGTNIPTSEKDPTPILPTNATLEQVEAVLKEMPREMVAELWNAVGAAVPGWGPAQKPKPAKSDEKKEEKSDEAKN